MDAIDIAVEEGLPEALAELAQLVGVPSVAARSDAPMQECAERVAALFRARGLEARLVAAGDGPPVVFAEDRSAGVDAPTILFYNHYDVQPAEPFELWHSDPWRMRMDNLTRTVYGRGVSDDKGHIICRLMALDALRKLHGNQLPFNIKVVVEGEEEIGSVHLPQWVADHHNILAADVCVWEFGSVDDAGNPQIICGLRGIAYFELHCRTLRYDAHSGVGGSLFPNAAWRLVRALNTLKSVDERILLPGFYDSVHSATEADLELLRNLPSEEEFLKREYGIETFLNGATDVEYRRQQVFEPTCTICGIGSGYQGEGAKTVLPAKAMAKLDFRLVPDQDPDTVRDQLRAHLDAHGFDDIEIRYLCGSRPARVNPSHPYVRLAAQTARQVYQREPAIVPLSGVSGPLHPFAAGLRQPVVTCGVGYPGSKVHAPNENLRLDDLLLGARHTAHFLYQASVQYPLAV
ncbi:MAG: M20/M25/M40 family metallo-hydrolase [Armatimonadaceae bacterium]